MSALNSHDDDFSNDEISELDEMDNERLVEVMDFLDAKYGQSGATYILVRHPEFYRFTALEVAYTLGHLLDPTNYEQTL